MTEGRWWEDKEQAGARGSSEEVRKASEEILMTGRGGTGRIKKIMGSSRRALPKPATLPSQSSDEEMRGGLLSRQATFSGSP